ncbi:hypothetical protein D3C81_1467940 [compost metagenome]
MTVQVVDAFEVIEVDQSQAMHHTGVHSIELTGGQPEEMPAIEQPGQFVGCDEVFELAHHSAQRVLVCLQREAPLPHAMA